MSRLGTKEWRDVRTLTWVYALLVPVAMLVVRWYLGQRYDGFVAEPEMTPRFLDASLPAAVVLFAALVASDVVAGDVASRRIEHLALLPVRPLTVWTAKVLVLVFATLVVAAWAFVAQAWMLVLIDGVEHAARFLDVVSRDVVGVVPAAAAIGCVLLVSTMGLRGLGAVLGGAMLCGALGVAYAWGRAAPRWIAGDDWIWVCIALGATFLASAVAFVHGRLHLQQRTRPALIGGVALALLLGVPALGLAAVARRVVPGSSLCVLRDWSASPHGAYVALTYVNRLDDEAGRATFILSLDDGVLREAESPGGAVGWQDDGTLVVERSMDDGTLVGALVDPATGRSVRPRVRTVADILEESHRRSDEFRARVWWNLLSTKEAGVWRLRNDKSRERLVRSVVRPASYQGTGDVRTFAIAPDADHLVRLDAETGEATPLFTSKGLFEGAQIVCPDAHGVVVRREGRWSWIDFAMQSVHRFPAEVRAVSTSLDALRSGRLHSCVFADQSSALVDPVSENILRIHWSEWRTLLPLRDGGVVLVREDGTFARYDASLTPLPAPQAHEEPR